jgi:hypothetical protein
MPSTKSTAHPRSDVGLGMTIICFMAGFAVCWVVRPAAELRRPLGGTSMVVVRQRQSNDTACVSFSHCFQVDVHTARINMEARFLPLDTSAAVIGGKLCNYPPVSSVGTECKRDRCYGVWHEARAGPGVLEGWANDKCSWVWIRSSASGLNSSFRWKQLEWHWLDHGRIRVT